MTIFSLVYDLSGKKSKLICRLGKKSQKSLLVRRLDRNLEAKLRSSVIPKLKTIADFTTRNTNYRQRDHPGKDENADTII